MSSLADARNSLREHFGFTDFREGQSEVISAILDGKDVVVVMPTGSGKSLCYQLPAMVRDGATLIVSPLIALMKDQVDALQARGLPATFINSSISESEQRSRIESLRRREHKLVYVAPERFRSSRFVDALKSISISLFAVDEAHCISTWGHDFRPDYLRLKSVRQSLGGAQTVALTATATPYVRTDIIEQLGLEKPHTFVSGFDRPNLEIEVINTQNDDEKLTRIVQTTSRHQGSGIIYTATRKAVERLTLSLKSHGLEIVSYHAGMTDALRVRAQDDFMSGRAQIIVATNAFGMGIDKPDIRFVMHYQFPGSIEGYYQEIGRAGRDGKPSSCILLFNYVDKNTHEFFIEGSYPDLKLIRNVYAGLVSLGTQKIELSTTEIADMVDERNELAVQSVLYLLERAGHIERTNSFSGPTNSRRRSRTILMLDKSPTELRVNYSDVSRRAALERRKLREMIEFCYTQECYRDYILEYFGDRHHHPKCGTCGNCHPRSWPKYETAFAPARRRKKKVEVKKPVKLFPRVINEDELLRARKILACAKRMKGRFGKQALAATLRGSAAKNILQAGLNELSTYGLLNDMIHDDILVFIDALIGARCLEMSSGEFPTVAVTGLGDRVMREQERVQLALPNSKH